MKRSKEALSRCGARSRTGVGQARQLLSCIDYVPHWYYFLCVKSSILTESELHRRIAQLDIERRREPRLPADGEIVLSVMRPNGFIDIRGTLVDTSLHGLRTRHEHTGLDRGQLLLVTYPWGTVIAEVEWSTPYREFTESGFRLL
jgi:hypothetical protein